jgi:hypothetical protein
VRRVGFLVRLFGPKLGTLAELDFDRSNKQIQIRLSNTKNEFHCCVSSCCRHDSDVFCRERESEISENRGQ